MGRDAVAVIISEALQARLDALPEPQRRATIRGWTTDEDNALRLYWPSDSPHWRRHADIAKILNRSEGACRARFEALQ